MEQLAKSKSKQKIITVKIQNQITKSKLKPKIEVESDVEAADKELNSKENYQNYKKRKHQPGRKFEISYEEFLEANRISCTYRSLPRELIENDDPEDLYIQKIRRKLP